MFASRLTTIVPYTTGIVGKVMGNISADSYQNDQTMLATLRAIIGSRIDKDTQFKGIIVELNELEIDDSFFRERNNCFVIGNIHNENEHVFDNFDKKIKERNDFQELTDIEKYLKEKCDINCRLIAGKEADIGAVYVQRMTTRSYHLMQSFIHRCLPNLFKDNPITEEEKEVLRGLTRSNSETYITAIEKLSKKLDIRNLILDNLLKGFEKKNTQKIIGSLERELENEYVNIDRIMDQHRQAIRRLNDVCTKINGLKYSMEESKEDELYEYLKARKNIDIINIEGDTVSININTYLEHFDTEQWIAFRKRGSVVHEYAGRNPDFANDEDRTLFLDAIFNEFPVLKVKMVGAYDLNISGYISARSIEGTVHDTCPNPHLEFHHCLGGNGPKIQEALRKGDIILAIEQCIASAGSVNLAETSQTFGPMIRNWFTWTDRKMFVNEDGLEMTASEALKWLKEQNYKGITENKIEFEEEENEANIPF